MSATSTEIKSFLIVVPESAQYEVLHNAEKERNAVLNALLKEVNSIPPGSSPLVQPGQWASFAVTVLDGITDETALMAGLQARLDEYVRVRQLAFSLLIADPPIKRDVYYYQVGSYWVCRFGYDLEQIAPDGKSLGLWTETREVVSGVFLPSRIRLGIEHEMV